MPSERPRGSNAPRDPDYVPTARPATPRARPASRPNPRPSSARMGGPGKARRPSSVRRRPSSARQRSRNGEDEDDYGYEYSGAKNNNQMYIIGGIVGGVVLLFLVLILAAGTGGDGAVVDTSGGLKVDENALYQQAKNHMKVGGKFQHEFEKAMASENRARARTAWSRASSEFAKARKILYDLDDIYGEKGGYTDLDHTIQNLSQMVHDLNKSRPVSF